jgi:hypothetical protein
MFFEKIYFEQKFSNKSFRTKVFEQKFSNKSFWTKVFEQKLLTSLHTSSVCTYQKPLHISSLFLCFSVSSFLPFMNAYVHLSNVQFTTSNQSKTMTPEQDFQRSAFLNYIALRDLRHSKGGAYSLLAHQGQKGKRTPWDQNSPLEVKGHTLRAT